MPIFKTWVFQNTLLKDKISHTTPLCTHINTVEGLFNSRFFNSDYSTQTIQLGLFNPSVKTQLRFTQVFYGLNEMELNNSG